VIAGLLHHGSGPAGHTDLLDPDFPDKIACFAHAAAERYPWVTDWTPVNEPLTTARFAALYGVWYPHERSEAAFARALLNEIHGTARAMRAIRAVIPEARLVQIEDLGKTHATLALRYQADFDNVRRWATRDLLCGYVSSDHHWMWRHFRLFGVDERELRSLADDPCPPQVIGIDYYLTSERFLDERMERYPAHTHGDNSHERYADIEAVRVLGDGLLAEPRALILEAYSRYQIPVAVTEVHLGCDCEFEQARWLRYVWDSALAARDDGAEVRGVTV